MTATDTPTGNDKVGIAPPPRRLPNTSGLGADASAPLVSPVVVEDPATSEKSTPSPKQDSAAAPPKPKAKAAANTKKTERNSPGKGDANDGDSKSTVNAKTKTTLHLPPSIFRRLKAWKVQEHRTTADGVMSAFISCGEQVASQFEVTEEDKVRLSYGLAPLATTRTNDGDDDDDGTRVVGVYILEHALDALDAAAKDLGLNRSRYAKALLDEFLPED